MATINLLPWREELRSNEKTIYNVMFWGGCFGDYNRIWGMVLF